MTYDRITNFLAVCETGSINKAAAKLFISQQSLSYSIATLEAELGDQLFFRSAKGVELTPFGTFFMEKAQNVVDAMEALNTACNVFRRQSITIGLPASSNYSSMSVALDHALAAYSREGNQVIKVVAEGDGNQTLHEMLLSRQIDVAYTHGPMKEDGIYKFELYRLPLCVLLPECHRFAFREFICMADLAEEPFVMPDSGTGLYKIIMQACTDAGFAPKIVCQSGYAKKVIDLVSQGQGIAIIEEQGACDAVRLYRNLNTVRIDPELELCYDLAISNTGKRMEQLKAFVDFITAQVHCNYRYVGI